MRISDWSSDVCSSDLQTLVELVQYHQPIGFGQIKAARSGCHDPGQSVRTDRQLLGIEGGLTHEYAKTLSRSEAHTSELQSLIRTTYAVLSLKKKQQINTSNADCHIKHNIINKQNLIRQ